MKEKSKRYKNLIGEKIGQYGYVKEFLYLDKFRRRIYLCICDCGKEFIKPGILIKKIIGCQQCGHKNQGRKLVKDLSNTTLDGGTKILELISHGNKTSVWKCICGECNKEYLDKTKRLLHPNYPGCCKKCAQKRCQRGSNHFNYKKELSDEDRHRTSIPQQINWRKSVLKKFNNRCIVTGRDYDLEAHHIENYSSCIDKRDNIENGVCMNKIVHRAFHVIYGFDNNNQDQLDEFISTYSW